MERNYISWNDALEIVSKDTSINLFSKVVTLWNALSLDALIMSLQSKGYIIKAYVVIAEHFSAGYLIDESCFVNQCSRFAYLPSKGKDSDAEIAVPNISIKDYYKFILSKKSSQNPLLYAYYNHTVPAALYPLSLEPVLNRTVIPCQIEEGVGAYMGTFDKTYPSFFQIRSLGEFRIYIRYSFVGGLIYKLLHPTYNSLTLRSSLTGLKVNKEILPYYRQIFEQRNSSIESQIDRKIMSKSIVICTVGWRRNEIQENEDFRVLKLVCDYLHAQGHHLFLKPHPRDSFFETQLETLHCDLLKVTGLTMESLCAQCQPKAIISFSSTTLINPKIFWNVPTYCVAGMLQRDKLSEIYVDEIDSFKRTFRNFVEFPKDVSEMSNII